MLLVSFLTLAALSSAAKYPQLPKIHRRSDDMITVTISSDMLESNDAEWSNKQFPRYQETTRSKKHIYPTDDNIHQNRYSQSADFDKPQTKIKNKTRKSHAKQYITSDVIRSKPNHVHTSSELNVDKYITADKSIPIQEYFNTPTEKLPSSNKYIPPKSVQIMFPDPFVNEEIFKKTIKTRDTNQANLFTPVITSNHGQNNFELFSKNNQYSNIQPMNMIIPSNVFLPMSGKKETSQYMPQNDDDSFQPLQTNSHESYLSMLAPPSMDEQKEYQTIIAKNKKISLDKQKFSNQNVQHKLSPIDDSNVNNINNGVSSTNFPPLEIHPQNLFVTPAFSYQPYNFVKQNAQVVNNDKRDSNYLTLNTKQKTNDFIPDNKQMNGFEQKTKQNSNNFMPNKQMNNFEHRTKQNSNNFMPNKQMNNFEHRTKQNSNNFISNSKQTNDFEQNTKQNTINFITNTKKSNDFALNTNQNINSFMSNTEQINDFALNTKLNTKSFISNNKQIGDFEQNTKQNTNNFIANNKPINDFVALNTKQSTNDFITNNQQINDFEFTTKINNLDFNRKQNNSKTKHANDFSLNTKQNTNNFVPNTKQNNNYSPNSTQNSNGAQNINQISNDFFYNPLSTMDAFQFNPLENLPQTSNNFNIPFNNLLNMRHDSNFLITSASTTAPSMSIENVQQPIKQHDLAKEDIKTFLQMNTFKDQNIPKEYNSLKIHNTPIEHGFSKDHNGPQNYYLPKEYNLPQEQKTVKEPTLKEDSFPKEYNSPKIYSTVSEYNIPKEHDILWNFNESKEYNIPKENLLKEHQFSKDNSMVWEYTKVKDTNATVNNNVLKGFNIPNANSLSNEYNMPKQNNTLSNEYNTPKQNNLPENLNSQNEYNVQIMKAEVTTFKPDFGPLNEINIENIPYNSTADRRTDFSAMFKHELPMNFLFQDVNNSSQVPMRPIKRHNMESPQFSQTSNQFFQPNFIDRSSNENKWIENDASNSNYPTTLSLDDAVKMMANKYAELGQVMPYGTKLVDDVSHAAPRSINSNSNQQQLINSLDKSFRNLQERPIETTTMKYDHKIEGLNIHSIRQPHEFITTTSAPQIYPRLPGPIRQYSQPPQQYSQQSYYAQSYEYQTAPPGITTEPMPILRQTNEIGPDGSFHYETLIADQTHVVQEGHIENPGTDNEEQVIHGSYSFVGDNGRTYTVNYVADGNGFRASGDHLPTPPPMPEVIQRSIEMNLAEEAKKSQEYQFLPQQLLNLQDFKMNQFNPIYDPNQTLMRPGSTQIPNSNLMRPGSTQIPNTNQRNNVLPYSQQNHQQQIARSSASPLLETLINNEGHINSDVIKLIQEFEQQNFQNSDKAEKTMELIKQLETRYSAAPQDYPSTQPTLLNNEQFQFKDARNYSSAVNNLALFENKQSSNEKQNFHNDISKNSEINRRVSYEPIQQVKPKIDNNNNNNQQIDPNFYINPSNYQENRFMNPTTTVFDNSAYMEQSTPPLIQPFINLMRMDIQSTEMP